MKVVPIPAGTLEAPGYILRIPGGWLTRDGNPTHLWYEHGVWPTPEAAERALERFVKEGKVEE